MRVGRGRVRTHPLEAALSAVAVSSGAQTRLYFIADGDDAVKVGVSADPIGRLRKMQVDNPRELKLIAHVPATAALERLVHRLLSDDRIRGEWFQPSDRVRDVVETFSSIAEICVDVEAGDEEPDVDVTLACLGALGWSGLA